MIALDYGAKWPIKFEPFPQDEFPELYEDLIEFVGSRIMVGAWCKMDDVQKCKLIEKIAIEVCKEVSPRKNFGIGQAEIRGGIIDALDFFGGDGSRWLAQFE